MSKKEVRLAVGWCRLLGISKTSLPKVKALAQAMNRPVLDVILQLPNSLS